MLEASAARKEQLLKSQDKYKKVEDMYLLFAKKASAFNSWFENAEEDLTDPVRCNSVEEIMVGPRKSVYRQSKSHSLCLVLRFRLTTLSNLNIVSKSFRFFKISMNSSVKHCNKLRTI